MINLKTPIFVFILFSANCFNVSMAYSQLNSAIGVYKPDIRKDDFTGNTIITTTGNIIYHETSFDYYVFINPEKMITPSGKLYYWISLIYQSSDWIFIEKGNSLKFLIDGKPLNLSTELGQDNRKHVLHDGTIYEEAEYPITPKELKRIASGSNVKFRFEGREYHVDGLFSEKNTEFFKKFVSEFIDKK